MITFFRPETMMTERTTPMNDDHGTAAPAVASCDILDLRPMARGVALRYFAARAAREGVFEMPDVDIEMTHAALGILDKVPDVPPHPGDEIPEMPTGTMSGRR